MTAYILSIVGKNIPDLPQHIILEFLGYKNRNNKYIKQLPKNMNIHDLLQDRTIPIYKNTYYSAVFDVKFINYHNHYIVKTLKFKYSLDDKNICTTVIQYYSIEFDDSRNVVVFYDDTF